MDRKAQYRKLRSDLVLVSAVTVDLLLYATVKFIVLDLVPVQPYRTILERLSENHLSTTSTVPVRYYALIVLYAVQSKH